MISGRKGSWREIEGEGFKARFENSETKAKKDANTVSKSLYSAWWFASLLFDILQSAVEAFPIILSESKNETSLQYPGPMLLLAVWQRIFVETKIGNLTY